MEFHVRTRRQVAITLVGVLASAGLVAAGPNRAVATPHPPGTGAGGLTEGLRPIPAKATGGPAQTPWEKSRVAPLGSSRGETAADVRFPEPGGWEVTLGPAGQIAKVSKGHAGPVRVAVPADVSGAAVGESLRVQIHDREAAKRLGVSGFVFTLSGSSRRGKAQPIEMTIDYSGFQEAYGGGYADRLQVVTLSGCAVLDPVPQGCDTRGTGLATRNNRETNTLTARAENLAEPAALAVTAGVEGETGTYRATPLSITGEWQVAPGSGEFNWSYPLSLPQPPGGSAPSLALGYSSGAIDGLTNATNPQGSPAGLGWGDFAGGFIERRYEPCVNAQHVPTRDLCWKDYNGIIALGGVSGVMFPLNGGATRWAIQSDEGWPVERLAGASGNGDNDGEYWKVTATDGTQYFFGQRADSGLQVPVVADLPDEPCHATSSCLQTWRWMLDRVVDTNGNTTLYRYQKYVNRYRSVEGLGTDAAYNPGAILTSIEYGIPSGGATAPARIRFEHSYRCNDFTTGCATAPTTDNGGSFPDTPNDLICSSGCTTYAPVFFNPYRYVWAQSEVRLSTTWRPVLRWNLNHTWARDSVNKNPRMVLTAIQQVGLADTDGDGNLSLLPRPDVRLSYARQANRVDADRAAGRDPMENWRLARIVNELGGETRIDYGHHRACPDAYTIPEDRWDQNTKDCFPQSVKEGNPGSTRRGIFRKYLVMSVIDMPMDGGPDVRTEYAYEGDPEWSYLLDAWTTFDAKWAWASWRGYGTIVVTQGASKTRMRVFRGMHMDKVLKDSGAGGDELDERPVSITDLDGNGPIVDERILAGRILQQERLGPLPGAAETRLQSTLYDYQVRVTHGLSDDVAEHRWPRWAGVVKTAERVYSAPGQFRERGGQTTYNANLRPATSTELGWLDVDGDERCTITTYADNPMAGMFNYPATNTMVTGKDCDTTNPARLLSYSETAYDDEPVGAAPARGNPTLQRARIEGTRFAETRTVFDSRGRVTRVTDPNGGVTTTAYKACQNSNCDVLDGSAIPTRVEVTNALGHKITSEYLQQYGVPIEVTDANGKVTSYGYDGLGRLESVWLPDAPYAFAEPSFRYSYNENDRVVRTRQLISEARTGADVRFIDNWTMYDGLGRERHTQAQSPTAGKVIHGTTTYDARGMVASELAPQAVTATPGTLPSITPENRVTYGYDALGRQLTENWYRLANLARTTTTEYTVDAVTVIGPEGNRVRQTVDGLGRTVAVAEHDGGQWVSARYAYDLADRLTKVTDPAGNAITYTYDLAGQLTSQVDPDAGSATFSYDNAGNQTRVVDGNGNTISTVYDPLGRARERWVGAPQTGTKMASWHYDAASERGLLDKEIRHTGQGDWVSDVTGYDIKDRATGTVLTVPAAIPGLSGTYTASQTYNRADHVVTMSLPAVGGLPAETLTTAYNTLGMPSTMVSGREAYVRGEVYDDRGRLVQSYRGPNQPGTDHTVLRTYAYNADHQLAGTATYMRTTQSGWHHQLVNANELDYDKAGKLVEREVWQGNAGSASWSECYKYDPRQRLTDAYTIAGAAVSGSADCATAPRGGGSQPYHHRYTYTADGRLDVRTEGDRSTPYEYPAAGQPQAHAPTSIGGDTYRWDDAGNLISRTIGGVTETFTWDAEQRLASVRRQDQTTSFIYDADGQRLLRRTASGATLYWAGHEITANADGSQVTGVRSYSFNGENIATRSPSGVQYLATNEAGSVEAAVAAPGQPATAQRAYEPFGQVRQAQGSFQTNRGFLGQIEDESTNLSYLNARYYDSTTGIFISPDPLYDTTEPKSLNPYVYSMGNPTTLSDPSGLSPLETFVLEGQISALHYANTQLVNEVQRLGGIIGGLQNIIKEQQNQIKTLLTYIGTLESIIRQQQSIIGQLAERVAYLEQQVAYWKAQAYHWYRQTMYWRSQANHWRNKANYWKARALGAAGSRKLWTKSWSAKKSWDSVGNKKWTNQSRKPWRASDAKLLMTIISQDDCSGLSLCQIQSGADWLGRRNWGDIAGGAITVFQGAARASTGLKLLSATPLCGPGCAIGGLVFAGWGGATMGSGAAQIRRGFEECESHCSTRDHIVHTFQLQIPLVGERIRCRRGGC